MPQGTQCTVRVQSAFIAPFTLPAHLHRAAVLSGFLVPEHTHTAAYVYMTIVNA